jgi:5'-3' exonuclease
MGVPGFFLWLWKKYKNTNFVFQKENLEINDNLLKDINNIDYLLIDTNCLIHPVCFKTIDNNSEITNFNILEDKMIKNVLEYIDMIISYSKPKKGVFIAIDGVAPVAKMKQQRSRRFKSVHDRELWDKIRKKHKKPIPKFWNNSAISPGTIFMEKLDKAIIEWSNVQKLEIIYSSCNIPAEGEHKLLQFIRNNEKENKIFSYLFYGLDADLIFLALSADANIYLLREANQMDNNKNSSQFNYISILVMKECIINTVKQEYLKINQENKDATLDGARIINDFIFLCYLLGNDFLPHLPSLDIHKNGIEYLLKSYISIYSELYDYLLKVGKSIKINNDFFIKFISKIAENEESIQRDHYLSSKKRARCESRDPFDQEIFKIENLQFNIIDNVQLGLDNLESWRKRYYKHYFGCDSEESIEEFCKLFVKNYLIGLKWVTLYYFDKCPSWEWYFPYEHPPFLSDIKKYLSLTKINKIKFEIGEPVDKYVQLLCVLPQQSKYLLPNKINRLMTDYTSPLAHLYPTDFEQDYLNKYKYWMAIPSLPPLEVDLVISEYNKLV